MNFFIRVIGFCEYFFFEYFAIFQAGAWCIGLKSIYLPSLTFFYIKTFNYAKNIRPVNPPL